MVSLLLRHAGFDVAAAGDVAGLRTRAEAPGCGWCVVRGGTDAAGARPLGGFLPAGGPDVIELVALVSGDGAPARGAGADLVVSLPFDPGAFTAELVDLSTAPDGREVAKRSVGG